MRSFQEMDKIIQTASKLLNEWDVSFETGDWSQTNLLKRQLRMMINDYYHPKKP
jgi:hypothetical protein